MKYKLNQKEKKKKNYSQLRHYNNTKEEKKTKKLKQQLKKKKTNLPNCEWVCIKFKEYAFENPAPLWTSTIVCALVNLNLRYVRTGINLSALHAILWLFYCCVSELMMVVCWFVKSYECFTCKCMHWLNICIYMNTIDRLNNTPKNNKQNNIHTHRAIQTYSTHQINKRK